MKLRFTPRATENLVEMPIISTTAIPAPRFACVLPFMRACKT
jgi:hypothetical protein